MRRSRHIVLAAAAATLAATTVASCSSGDEGSGKTVTVWTHTHPPMIKVYKDLIKEFEDENPDLKVEYQTIPNDEFNTKMLTSMSNGSGPCVINMDDSALRGEYIPKKLLAPLDPKAFGESGVKDVEARYVDGTLDGAKGDDGTLYGLPSEYNATAFAINKAHFADAGLDPASPPASWTEVGEMAQKLKAKGHDEGFSFLYLHSGWYSQQLQTLLKQSGGKIADGDKGALDSEASKAALQVWADLTVGPDRAADPNSVSREATEPFQDLATGKASMAMVYPWSMDQIRDTNPDTYKDLQVVPLPQIDPANPVNRSYGYYWAVGKDCDDKAQAWKFVAFLADHPQDFLTGTSFVQPLKGWEDTPAAKKIPFIDVWGPAYGQGRFDEVTPSYAEVQDVIKDMVNAVVFDKKSVDDASKDATEAVTRIFAG
jgi:multiple sugar transport system substrate-binding protein